MDVDRVDAESVVIGESADGEALPVPHQMRPKKAGTGAGDGERARSQDGAEAFAPRVAEWIASLGGLRNLVRQELVSRQLAAHLPNRPVRVLDVGCGQGTQLLRLARIGHRVTGMESSDEMLTEARDTLAHEPAEVRGRIRLVAGDGRDAGRFFAAASFDVVCCHGVLMYVPDPDPLLATLTRVLAPGGLLSLLVRNADGLAMRAGLHGRWTEALEAFGAVEYKNRLGLRSRADTVAGLASTLRAFSVPVRTWYGVRVFSDLDEHSRPPRSPAELDAVLACEEEAGRRDPYRQVAALLHIVATKSP